MKKTERRKNGMKELRKFTTCPIDPKSISFIEFELREKGKEAQESNGVEKGTSLSAQICENAI